ncbi:MAG: Hsp20 family protein [Sphingomonadales bacterium]
MRTFDLTPLFRSAVGFDRTSRLVNSAFEQLGEPSPTYPPYNIETLGEDQYRISMAVAGFAEQQLEITAAENTLSITGKDSDDADGRTYLHRGIASRAFKRSFQLADYIVVTGARLANGLLEIDLVRELPEAIKPRAIPILAGPKIADPHGEDETSSPTSRAA